jgi:uncharacterized membrane protein YeaQ/YmgE (transglycosylase-associated protein family)
MYHGFWSWLFIGLIAGWLGGKITRGRGFGLIADIFLGLVGGVVGGWVFERLGVTSYGFIGSLAAATVGAVILVAIGRLFTGSHDR